MNTYKIFIETDLSVTALKNYSYQYLDIKADTAEQAVEQAKAQHGKQYKVELVSII